MLSHAKIIFRKLRGSSSRSSRGSEPAPSAPATTAESGIVNPSPRAIHFSDVRRSPTELPPWSDAQSISIIVVNAKGAADDLKLYRITFAIITSIVSASSHPAPRGLNMALSSLMQHVCLIFTYDSSSRESWDEVVAAYKRMRNRCKDGVLPFLATMIAAMGEGEGEASVLHAEAEAFAAQWDCLFAKFSPITGRGICDAVGSLVELAHGARDQYTKDQQGHTQRHKRAETLQALFSSYKCPAQDWHHHG
ncbi:uncharacterized protein Aud_003482 [Aspergillus udagawae]|uniref:Uncharacterized protein n=1 Tax=Aspergillus udagawae TaxID=91492 RepID=A0A8E0UY78_9EURO|nr:uncharacterized protein Aud_003482 [Aspergillus udagawae]GIC87101.1 hypothetical protein Aud_003482 [Aspergillus udagawae]